ncbi:MULTISPECIES: phage holin [Yersinia]|uniref:phage holin n=1 Tax=Yersinia TaxID=629 RepID=UPI00110EEC37|nr:MULTISPECIES: phage holin [Yersinia]MCB5319115.1 class II holin family protein [Yersinia massiliensis]QDW32870.1 peptidoglycan-binding protein LysM [Yersinia sp. KBS0713]
MKMSNIASNASYLVSGGSFIFWVKELIAGFTPDEWTVIGVLGSLFFMALTFLLNAGIKIWDRRHGYKPDGE